jgi:hypothetical protein
MPRVGGALDEPPPAHLVNASHVGRGLAVASLLGDQRLVLSGYGTRAPGAHDPGRPGRPDVAFASLSLSKALVLLLLLELASVPTHRILREIAMSTVALQLLIVPAEGAPQVRHSGGRIALWLARGRPRLAQ